METASLSEIKKELKTVAPQQLQELCLRSGQIQKREQGITQLSSF
jgi:hypothetical protein